MLFSTQVEVVVELKLELSLAIIAEDCPIVGRNSTRTVTSMWTVPRPGRKQRLSARARNGRGFRDTWLQFTLRRRISSWPVLLQKQYGLVGMIFTRRNSGLGLMALLSHTVTGTQENQTIMGTMRIA